MATKIVIDTKELNVPWELGTTYRIEIEKGFVNSVEGTKSPSGLNENVLTFSTFADPPAIQSLDPTNGSTMLPMTVPGYRSLEITFNRQKVQPGSGNIELYKSDTTLVHSFDVESEVTFVNNTVSINLNSYLEPATSYYVLIDSGAILDFDGFAFPGVTANNVISFTSATAPVIDFTIPADNATDVLTNDKFVIAFDSVIENVVAGNLYLYKVGSPDTLIKTFNVSSDGTINTLGQVEFDIIGLLDPSSNYYFLSDSNFQVSNYDGFDFTGIFQIDFSTSAALNKNILGSDTPYSNVDSYYNEDGDDIAILNVPTIVSANPAESLTLTITPDNISAIDLISSSGTGGTTDYTSGIYTITGTSSQINSHLDTLLFTPANDVDFNITLTYETVDSTAVQSSITQTLVISQTNNEIINIELTRNFLGSQANLIFASDTPYIEEIGEPLETVYDISFTSPNGLFGIPGSIDPTNLLELSDTRANLNSLFATIAFYPDAGITSDTTFTYTQYKGATQQANQAVQLHYTGTTSIQQVYNYGANATFVPTTEEKLYGSAYVVIVGGGGGGGGGSLSSQGGGGGGGGQAIVINEQLLTENSYPIVVGSGGTAGTFVNSYNASFTFHGGSGGNSSAFGQTAQGGFGGRAYYFGGATWSWDKSGGGNGSFSGGTNTGTLVTSFPGSQTEMGGGGAGAAGNGQNPYISGGNPHGGNGGSALVATDTRTGNSYTVGGGGAGGSAYLSGAGTPGAGTYGRGGNGQKGLTASATAGSTGRVIIVVRNKQ